MNKSKMATDLLSAGIRKFEEDGDTNLANIVDEILSVLDRTSYLLTLS